MNVFDRPPTLMVYVDIWRPMWCGNEPRVFWRELLPPINPELARFRSQWKRSEWRVMDSDFFEVVRMLPNRYFTVDAEPGRTYCWRPLKDKHAGEADKRAVRCLRNGTRDVSGELDRAGIE